MNLNSFISTTEYIDENNYPQGFHGSADFTEFEADILRVCGNVVIPLVAGKYQPVNSEQQRLKEVIQGNRDPIFFIEKVFMKYFNLTGMNSITAKY